jgi:Dynein, heavy chain
MLSLVASQLNCSHEAEYTPNSKHRVEKLRHLRKSNPSTLLLKQGYFLCNLSYVHITHQFSYWKDDSYFTNSLIPPQANLTKEQNLFKITLKGLEDDLLMRLSSSGGDVLSDKNLVLNLEKSKKTAKEIEIKVKEGKKTAKKIDEAREQYRPAAERASVIYFIMNELFKINPIYQFSLKVSSSRGTNLLFRARATK